jgi:hypothetical protein
MSKQIEDIRNNQNVQECSKVQKENVFLMKWISELENDLTKFVSSKKTFDKILGSQSGVFDKAGIGYKPYQNKRLYKNFFHPQKRKKTYKCTFCQKEGHIEAFCFKKKAREQHFSKTRKHSPNILRKKVYAPPHRRTSYQHKKNAL